MKRAVLVLLAACGGSDHHTTDAPPLDAPSDSLPISGDGTPGGVQLHITQNGQPVGHVATFFLGTDDRVLAALETNDGGIAAAMLPGGSVTVVLHAGSGLDKLWTFTDVQAGDMLELALDPPGPATGNNVTVTAPPAGAYDYGLNSGCGDRVNSLDGTFVFTPLGCGATADFVVTLNDNLAVPQAALIAQNVSLDGNPVLNGLYAPVVLPAFSYSGVDASVQALDTRVQLRGLHGVLYAADDLETPLAGAVTTRVRLPDTTGLGMTADVVSQVFPVASELGQQTIHEIVDPSVPYSLDLASAMVPRYTAAPAYDVASRTLGWGEAASATQATVVRAAIHGYRDAIPAGRTWSWRIIAAKTATHITFPALPPLDGFSFVPAAGDTVGVDELTTANVPYAAFRTHGFDAPALASGRVAIETLYTPPM